MTQNVKTRILDDQDFYFFNMHGHDIRAVEIGGEQWYVEKDVCDFLGITSRTAYRKLDTDQRCELNRAILGLKPGKPMTAISESGLYMLIFRSEKPTARHFRNWVTQIVLPSIIRSGGYFLGEEFVTKRKSEEDEFVWLAMNILHDRCSGHIN